MADVYTAKIISNTSPVDNICDITLSCSNIAAIAKAGQFLHIKCAHSHILRRPISICNVDSDAGTLRIVCEIKGSGTKWLSERASGESLDILGPLGRGFHFPDGDIIVVGGGIGSPPMLFAAHSARKNVDVILGFRTKSMIILEREFLDVSRTLTITTDDGSAGIHGMVTLPLENMIKTGCYSAVLSCGPRLMQKAVAEVCARYNITCQVSLEERMGCGVGACLVCACATMNIHEGKMEMSRVCVDGPVFDAKTVVW